MLFFMKSTAIVLLALGTIIQSCGQSPRHDNDETKEFIELVKSRPYFPGRQNSKPESLVLPIIYKDPDFEIRLADRGLSLDEKQVVLKNPYSDSEYPLSFSVIYKNRIVSLFEPGKFACYDLTMNRDMEFERKLNEKTFKYHWIIDNTLVAKSDDSLYTWAEEKGWVSFQNKNPMEDQPKLFEDNRYVVYFHCHGEFGGTIYFYDKLTEDIYVTEATCPNSVNKQDNKYLVLSTLGHMMGNMELKSIANPSTLPKLKDLKKLKLEGWAKSNIGYADSSNNSKKEFEYYGILSFSSFKRKGELLYWIHWNDFNFLAAIDNNIISVVDPLFIKDEIYTHDPVTATYDHGVVLMNFDFYGLGREREVSLILVDKDTITKVDWNENH
jgi:hypothetical protein